MKKRDNPMPSILGVGTASVILTFMVLALVTFAILAYSSAASDYRLSEKAAERASAYYTASNRAQTHMGEVDGLLQSVYRKTDSEAAYLDEAANALEKLSWVEETKVETLREEGAILFSWGEAINDRQHLAVLLRIEPPRPGKLFYAVARYRVETAADWKGDTSLNVYGSEKAQ